MTSGRLNPRMRRGALLKMRSECGASDRQLNDARLMARLGAQVVMINADLLHFQAVPSALESSIGGVVLIGSKAAPHTSTKNAAMSKERVIAVIPCFHPGSGLALGGIPICD
jgi:hypothetical protein